MGIASSKRVRAQDPVLARPASRENDVVPGEEGIDQQAGSVLSDAGEELFTGPQHAKYIGANLVAH
jgi:hypothetical protein